MRVVTLMDNQTLRSDLTAEHGLSFFIDTGEHRLLFDFGATGEHTLRNAEKLGIDPRTAEAAVCSHGHYDHACGYPAFVRAGVKAPFVTGLGFFEEKYSRKGYRATYLGTGFSPAFLAENGIRHLECDGELELFPGCHAVNGFARSHAFETIPERFVLRRTSCWQPDPFSDEIALVLETAEGLLVIVGCSHPGILNILISIRERFGRPIHAVLGGTHLMEADEERIEETLRQMKELGIRIIGFNHCSGEAFRERLKEDADLHAQYFGAGDYLFL